MHSADLALRSAAISQLVLLAAVLLRAHWRHPVGPLGALYLMGIAAYLLCPPVARHWHLGWTEFIFFVGCFGAAVYFRLFSRAMFGDSFRLWPESISCHSACGRMVLQVRVNAVPETLVSCWPESSVSRWLPKLLYHAVPGTFVLRCLPETFDS